MTNARLTVNFQEVPPCACDSGGPHWSTADISSTLGRPVTSADALRVEVVSDPAAVACVHEPDPSP